MNVQRWLLLLAALNGVVLLGVAAQSKSDAPAAVPKVLRAEALELVDRNGQVRASITVEASGEAVLRLRDGKGTIRVKVGASETGSALLLLDEATNPGVHMLAKQGKGTVTLSQGDGPKRVLAP